MDPLDALNDPCPNCGTHMFDNRCRGCDYERPLEEVVRPQDGDDLPGLHG